ncbi:MAG: Spy/CpxP family protein refolding chaperone, partial [Planctomycetes bacterium]|nr:Spy/CpxP family protein refolding chaperone [Planctomycetota bacterium]
LMADLKLPPEKEKAVRLVIETYFQDMAQWMRENGPVMRDLMAKMHGGRGRPGAGQPPAGASDEQRKAAMEKYRELMKQRAEKQQELFKQLKDLLDKEQMALVHKALGGGRPSREASVFALLRRLDLTEDQRAKVKEIMSAAREAAKDKQGPDRAEIYRDAGEKVVKEVLTDAQRAKLAELRRAGPGRGPSAGAPGGSRGMFAGLDLTDDQKAKIREIMTDAREKAKAASDPSAKKETFRDAMKKIAEEVLTPEQREKLQKQREERRRRFQNRPGRGGKAGGRGRPQPRQ